VMLDAENTYKRFAGEDIDIFWGAYVGMPDEILVSRQVKGCGRRDRNGCGLTRGGPMDGSWTAIVMRRAGRPSLEHRFSGLFSMVCASYWLTLLLSPIWLNRGRRPILAAAIRGITR